MAVSGELQSLAAGAPVTDRVFLLWVVVFCDPGTV